MIAGIRKEYDKKDVYKVAEKIVKLMLNDGETLEELREADET